MKDHHLQLNLAKTQLLAVSANPSLHHNFTFQLGSSTITSSKTARNLGVVIDDKLNFSDHIAKTARSGRFALCNIRKIRHFLSERATQLLVQALVLSRLDYCNALLAGLPSNSIKPLQLIQNAAARLIFNEPKRTHVTPLFINLHWLPEHVSGAERGASAERSVRNIVGARSGFLSKGRSDRSVSLRFRSDTAHTTSLGHA